jgi:hypothetical protein
MSTTTISTRQVEYHTGFYYTNWTLNVNGKDFLLGQDVKWCIRALGIDINDFFKFLDCDDTTEEGREKIGKWIVKEFKLTPKVINKLEPWSLCCQ